MALMLRAGEVWSSANAKGSFVIRIIIQRSVSLNTFH